LPELHFKIMHTFNLQKKNVIGLKKDSKKFEKNGKLESSISKMEMKIFTQQTKEDLRFIFLFIDTVFVKNVEL
jgi:hypothetical protein